MVFNSIEFLIFICIFLPLFYICSTKEKLRDGLLLSGSYLFYMAWYWQYAGLIVLSTLVDHFVGREMDKQGASNKKRKALLILSLIVNLGVLAIFKYYNFFYEASQTGLSILGIDIPDAFHQLLLPVGISFYTFQTLSYTIDLYRKNIKHEQSLLKFAVFVSFFPQLVAGPIVRAKDFLPQLHCKTTLSTEQFNTGLWMVFLGLFKKIIVADLLAYLIVDSAFENPTAYSSTDLLISLYAYSFQIYCDFSGYTDIAIGIALMMGFHLPINFNRPYISQSPSEFWKRWHISLSSWLRDYLYISLGGNRGKSLFTSRNLMITMLLGGLWHGAAWNFILWGLFHGLILILTKNVVIENSFNYRMLLKIFINFHLIVFSWLLFRVSDMGVFVDYVSGLTSLTYGTQFSLLSYFILSIIAVAHFVPKSLIHDTIKNLMLNRSSLTLASIYACLLFLFAGTSINTSAFIYFRF